MILITASNGKLGQAVTAELALAGATSSIRLAARNPATLEAWHAQGFDVTKADYDDPASLDAAFAGIGTLLLISSDGPTADRIRQHQIAIDAAKRAGIRRVVYTSFTNPVATSKFVWAQAHLATEPYLRDSGLAFTILRNNQYCTNIDPMLNQAKESGFFAIPGATGKVAYVRHEDLAAATAKVLLEDGHNNQIFELTGSEAFNGEGVAALLSEALGRPVTAVDASPDEFAAYFRSIALPEYLVEGLITNYAAAQAGEHAAVSRDIERLTGRPAGSLRDYIQNRFRQV